MPAERTVDNSTDVDGHFFSVDRAWKPAEPLIKLRKAAVAMKKMQMACCEVGTALLNTHCTATLI
jgi:hypothetical protein